MANKRSLKHAINMVCKELFAEAIAASLYGNQVNNDNADGVLYAIIKMQADFVSRISHPEPGLTPKAYYKKLREDFTAQASEIIDQINNL
ncbi:hypothetical protein L6472_06495 [Prevotella sp. E13-17]|uniref:hypothetical protein n=1 Tax=Prevotella sp. E13-17 TaxID=2913616 RepID=UPI001EDBFC5C|nr:hypothetical protein [Prevotella sp. E13-17]UKK52223.1 hypothetical protein L6472_06495 [Prevotella sp. E13-17]